MTSIVFEPFHAEMRGSGLGVLPALRGFGAAGFGAQGYGLARLPALRQTPSGVQAPQRLPALRGFGAVGTSANGYGFATLPPLVGFGSAVGLAPKVSMGFATLPALVGFGQGSFEMAGSGEAALPALRGFGGAGFSAGGYGHARLPALTGFGIAAGAVGESWISVLQSPGVVYMTASASVVMVMNETLHAGDALDAAWIQLLQDRLRITSTPAALLDALASINEPLTFQNMVGIAYAMLVKETLAIGGSPTASLRYALQLVDALTLVSGTRSALDAQVTVATAFALADSLASVHPNALTENMHLAGTASATLRATLALLDTLRVQDGMTPGVTWLVQTNEAFALTDANATTATLGMLLADGIEMLGELRFDDGAYLAWVVNTETRAFVKYRNFPFNSFARIGNRYFGCSGDGIYELVGDDDAGEPINAVVRGGLTDLGSSLLKNMPGAYIGYRAGDQMVLKVTVMAVQKTGDIGREEHWYRMEPRQANAIRENRVKLGRGLKSTYWGWELININGADFDLDSFSWYPIVLERRLN